MINIDELVNDYLSIMEDRRINGVSGMPRFSRIQRRWERQGHQLPDGLEEFLDLLDEVLIRVNELQKGGN